MLISTTATTTTRDTREEDLPPTGQSRVPHGIGKEQVYILHKFPKTRFKAPRFKTQKIFFTNKPFTWVDSLIYYGVRIETL